MRVLFWGTPTFATPPLRALLGEGFDVVGVVTQPDRAVGRSRSELKPSAVKEVALAESLPVLQPESARDADFGSKVRDLTPDISVVVAYGHILPKALVDLPRLGTLNIHASLLPLLRGAAPIQAAIREGHRETGVTIMQMVERLDAGPTILQLSTEILDDETYGELELRLSELGAEALIEALTLLDLGKAKATPQTESEATYASKINRETTRVDWARDAATVSRAVRAYDPRPGALTTLDGKDVKLFGARRADDTTSAAPGTVTAVRDDGLVVACASGAVVASHVQPAGQRRMAAIEWQRGRGIAVGARLQ